MIEKIERLSKDKAFGILTRNALDEEISIFKSKFNAIFIDLNNIHKLNGLLGYEKVNSIIRDMFASFDFQGAIVGRWFSGDEIVIAKEGVLPDMQSLVSHAHKFDMTFKYKIFYGLKNIEDLEKKKLHKLN